MSTEPNDYEKLKNERDVLLEIEGAAQKRHTESERVISLLLAAGLITEEKLTQARDLARVE